MKGRWSYDGVNSAVDEYNNALSNRYNFLNKGFQAMASAASKKRFKVRFGQFYVKLIYLSVSQHKIVQLIFFRETNFRK